ncbi:MAG: carbohydrate ABC transporter permease [bacterium]
MKKGKYITLQLALVIYIFFLLFFVAQPLFYNTSISFRDLSGKLTISNYVKFLTDPILHTIIFNTFIWTIGSIVFQMLMGLIVALTLARPFPGYILARMILLVLPWAMPDVVAAVSWQWMYNDMYGVINDILQKLHLVHFSIPWLSKPGLARVAVIIANIWKGYPLSGMFYLAALQGIPQEVFEAAAVDGSSSLQTFFYISLPSIRKYIITTLMLTTIWTINYFPLIYTMTGGGPANATDTFVTYAYRLAFRFLDFHGAAAVSTINFLIIIIPSLIYLRILNNMGGETTI